MAVSERVLWVNADRTVMVDTFNNGDTLNVAVRGDSDMVWGPPQEVIPETSYTRPNAPNKERRILDLDPHAVELVEGFARDAHLSFSQAIEVLAAKYLG